MLPKLKKKNQKNLRWLFEWPLYVQVENKSFEVRNTVVKWTRGERRRSVVTLKLISDATFTTRKWELMNWLLTQHCEGTFLWTGNLPFQRILHFKLFCFGFLLYKTEKGYNVTNWKPCVSGRGCIAFPCELIFGEHPVNRCVCIFLTAAAA